MDDVKKRLQESSESCVNSYDAWNKKKTDSAAREALQEAVHELRKVASRVEIEMVMSDRDKKCSEPLPIPPHRSSSKRSSQETILPDIGNEADHGNSGAKKKSGGGARRGGRSRKPSNKKDG